MSLTVTFMVDGDKVAGLGEQFKIRDLEVKLTFLVRLHGFNFIVRIPVAAPISLHGDYINTNSNFMFAQ